MATVVSKSKRFSINTDGSGKGHYIETDFKNKLVIHFALHLYEEMNKASFEEAALWWSSLSKETQQAWFKAFRCPISNLLTGIAAEFYLVPKEEVEQHNDF